MIAFQAAEAARMQGEQAFRRYQGVLLSKRHDEGSKFDEALVLAAAAETGLDLERFRRDLYSDAALERLARDHIEATTRYGVFGTPTFVLPDGNAGFVKIMPPPPTESAVAVLDQTLESIARPYFHEIKRPVPVKKD